MWFVLAMLMPSMFAAWRYFGISALVLASSAMISAVAAEWAVTRWLFKKESTVSNGSAALTGLLLAMNCPPDVPVWLVVIGSFFAIAIAKMAFGGLGHNIFNPALAARAFLLLSWPGLMTHWTAPLTDGMSTATPLAIYKLQTGFNLEATMHAMKMSSRGELYKLLFFGRHAGSMGETSVLALLIGGGILLLTGAADYRISFSYLATVAAGSVIAGVDPLFMLLSGGVMLGALFMATDPVTAPLAPGGRWIFGIGCGVLTMALRVKGMMNEGVCYSILIMNALTPLIDRYVRPLAFGQKRRFRS